MVHSPFSELFSYPTRSSGVDRRPVPARSGHYASTLPGPLNSKLHQRQSEVHFQLLGFGKLVEKGKPQVSLFLLFHLLQLPINFSFEGPQSPPSSPSKPMGWTPMEAALIDCLMHYHAPNDPTPPYNKQGA